MNKYVGARSYNDKGVHVPAISLATPHFTTSLSDIKSEMEKNKRKLTSRRSALSDIYEAKNVEDAKKEVSKDPFHFQDASYQYINDSKRAKPFLLTQMLARVCGRTFMRQVSNFFAHIGLGRIFDARRDYPVLPPDTLLRTSQNQALLIEGRPVSAEKLAELFKPRLSSISQDLTRNESIAPKQIRYEVLPPKSNNQHYSIMYYVGRETEKLPMPILGKLYDWVRPILYGSKQDWEVIQIDIDRDSGKPTGMAFETSNYTNNASSFDVLNAKNMHLRTTISKRDDFTWTRRVYQKNGESNVSDIASPFGSSTHPEMVIVSWNGAFDVVETVNERGYSESLYGLSDVPMSFMDIDTYCDEGIDLRATWLESRKQGQCVMLMPPRKSASDCTRINLIGERMPALVGGN